MRLFRRFLIVTLFFIAAIFIFVPPLIGLVFQKAVDIRMSYLGLKKDIDVQIVSYKRGWFTSEVISRLKLTHPDLRHFLMQLGIDNATDTVDLVFFQKIQHGPIFYAHQQLPSWFGIAAIDRKLLVDEKQATLFDHVGITDSVVQVDQTLLGFSGKYFTRIELGNYHLRLPHGLHVRFRSLQSDIWLSSFAQRIEGNVSISHLSLDDATASALLPDVNIRFDLHKDPQGLWIENQSLGLSEIIVRDADGKLFSLNNFQVSSVVDEEAGLIDVRKKLSMQNLQINNQQFGPFLLQISINRLNAKAISDLIETYRDITLNGELYESQLRQKMMMMFPAMVSPGTSVRLDTLDVVTPSGHMQMNGQLIWPNDHFSKDNSMADLAQTAEVRASLKISTALANDLIDLIAKMIYVYQIPIPERLMLMDVEEQVRLETQQTVFIISDLVSQGRISKQDGTYLAMLVRQNALLEDFTHDVKELFLTKHIQREDAYLLVWQFSELANQTQSFQAQLRRYQDSVAEKIHKQLDDFVEQGFVSEEKGDYVVTLQREKGVVRLGGRELKN